MGRELVKEGFYDGAARPTDRLGKDPFQTAGVVQKGSVASVQFHNQLLP
jgi:hypothetical protein